MDKHNDWIGDIHCSRCGKSHREVNGVGLCHYRGKPGALCQGCRTEYIGEMEADGMDLGQIMRELRGPNPNAALDRREAVVRKILAELKRAREIHPDWPKDVIHQAGVVVEEAGEVMKAALQSVYEKPFSVPDYIELEKELVQTAAMCVRMLTEESASTPVFEDAGDGNVRLAKGAFDGLRQREKKMSFEGKVKSSTEELCQSIVARARDWALNPTGSKLVMTAAFSAIHLTEVIARCKEIEPSLKWSVEGAGQGLSLVRVEPRTDICYRCGLMLEACDEYDGKAEASEREFKADE